MLKIIGVTDSDLLDEAKSVFSEYVTSLGFELDFQHFDKELVDFPGEYSPPDGCILLAEYDNQIAGCVALRKFENDICEMKRLYVRHRFRGRGIGRKLAGRIIEQARQMKYTRMRLDTVPEMIEAIALYHSLGFEEIKAYRYNPIEGARFMELRVDETEVDQAGL